jgi:hypothetical protein
VRPSARNGLIFARPNDVDNIVAFQDRAEIAKDQRRLIIRRFGGIAAIRVDGELFIMADSKYLVFGEEPGLIDGGAVIDDVNQRIIFICNARVINIDEPVHASRQQAYRVGRVKLELQPIQHDENQPTQAGMIRTYFRNVIIMTLYILHQWLLGRPVVPTPVCQSTKHNA